MLDNWSELSEDSSSLKDEESSESAEGQEAHVRKPSQMPSSYFTCNRENFFRGNTILDDVYRFRKMCQKRKFEVKSSWTGAYIPEMKSTQLDTLIHCEGLNEIVDRMTKKLKAVGYLPEYLKNDADILKKYLPEKQVDLVIQRLVDKKRNFETVVQRRLKLIESLNPDDMMSLVFDSEIEKIIIYLSTSKCLDLFHRKNQLPLSERVRDIVQLIEKLMNLMSARMDRTAEQEHERKEKLRGAFQEFRERSKLISKLEELLQAKTHNTDLKMKEKDVAIRAIKLKTRKVKKQIKNEIEDIVQDSGIIMMKVDQFYSERHEGQAAEAVQAQQNYTQQLEQHLLEEKLLRSRRYKIETQLASWINKYDQEIGDRQEQLEQLEEGFDNEQIELLELQCLYREQELIYTRYKEQKEAEDAANFAAEVRHFCQTLAARRIQRFWRTYKAKKLARRRAKKDKSKARISKK